MLRMLFWSALQRTSTTTHRSSRISEATRMAISLSMAGTRRHVRCQNDHSMRSHGSWQNVGPSNGAGPKHIWDLVLKIPLFSYTWTAEEEHQVKCPPVAAPGNSDSWGFPIGHDMPDMSTVITVPVVRSYRLELRSSAGLRNHGLSCEQSTSRFVGPKPPRFTKTSGCA